MKSLEDLRAKFRDFGQDHVFHHWSSLSWQEASKFLDQLKEVDLFRSSKAWDQIHESSEKNLSFDKIKSFDGTNSISNELKKYRMLGEEILASGSAAAFTVAGGQGTRLGHNGPKGTIECTPISKKSLFQHFAENLSYHSKKYGHVFNWFIMTSKTNHHQTIEYFAKKNYFGYAREKIHFFEQGMIPAFDHEGKFLLAKKNELAMSPDGHGGSLQALKKAGMLDLMAKEKIDFLSYFQVDNPMVNCLDPTFIGLHSYYSSEMSSKAVKKINSKEKVGTLVSEKNKVKVIEYSDLPKEIAEEKEKNGALRYGLGSIAIHVFNRSFIERVLSKDEDQLPFHAAHKIVPFINNEGVEISPTDPNGIKVETFIFDALPKAKNSLVYEIAREEEFAPIKNKNGADSLETSKKLQLNRACKWVDEAKIPRFTNQIEICPSWSPSFEEFIQNSQKIDVIDPINQATIFDKNGPTLNI